MVTPKIVIYQDYNFKRSSREITSDIMNLGDLGFQDRTSSIKVFGSVWVGYEDSNYNGRMYVLEEGEYSHPDKWHGSNDQLSPLRQVNLGHVGMTPSIVLYEHSDYQGQHYGFDYPVNDLRHFGFNDKASSLKVKIGAWVLYQDTNFNGRHYVVSEGDYRDAGHYKNDSISSLRPVREPAFTTEVLSMTFDLVSALLTSKPVALVNLSQTNNSSLDQKPTWSSTRTVTTTKTYEFHWDNSLAVKAEATFNTGVPVIAEGKVKMSVENKFSIGEKRGDNNTQSDQWTFALPANVKPHTSLRAQVTIQQGKVTVPFKAVLRRGVRVWEEQSTYEGTQSYNLNVDYQETPAVKSNL